MRNLDHHLGRLIFIFGLGVFCCGCAERKTDGQDKYSETRLMMGTVIQIDVCRRDESRFDLPKIYGEVWGRMGQIDGWMSVYNAQSDVVQINGSKGDPVRVHEDTYIVLQRSKRFTEMTQGAFDVTVGPLIELWRRSEKADSFPSREEILRVKNSVGSDKIKLLESHQVQLLNPDVKIDLGGIAAGYAIDEPAGIFRSYGMKNFFIDIGGDIYVGGTNCRGELWKIGIRDPRDRGRIIDVVRVSDQAVSTSGDYEKFFEIQGQKGSHIINPVTGYPKKGILSATVIAPTALEADVWATALCVLGPRLGIPVLEDAVVGSASMVVTSVENGKAEKTFSKEYKKFHDPQ